GPSKMVDVGSSDIKHMESVVFCPPTEVYFFLMGEVILVKTFEFMEDLAFYEHTGARCPKDFGCVVVLSQILLQFLKNPPPTKGIPKFVQKTARRPGIFKMVLLQIIQYFGLYDVGLCILH